MGILKFFSGKDPEDYEQKGDSFFQTKKYGLAKIEYETALNKLEKKFPTNADYKNRLQEKILHSNEALALQHKQTGEELIGAEMFDEADEIVRLALELTKDPELTVELEKQLQEIRNHFVGEESNEIPDLDVDMESTEKVEYQGSEEEYFAALCGSLPEEMRKAYCGYSKTFKEGYVALNQGDFERAAVKLSHALEENPSPHSFIPLELATAYLNLQKYDQARVLLEGFMKEHPDSIQGYHLLCEIFWEIKAFDQAQKLLLSCPEEVANSLPIQLLQGETLFQAKRYQEAESLYLDYLKSSGWDETIARSLAKTYEALFEKEKARGVYGEIMRQCPTCGVRIDPFIKQRYADLSFESGKYSTDILELYLSLVQEDPNNKAYYYKKIIHIYSAQGNEQEARRYQSFARKLKDNGR
jgi:predicted negative regulator of RcsB-dependent stress response